MAIKIHDNSIYTPFITLRVDSDFNKKEKN